MKSDNTERLIWFNGNIMPVKDATINILSPTAQFGLNVFEGIRCYWNQEKQQLFAFMLNQHYQRLLNSAKMLHIYHEYTVEKLQKGLFDVVKANNYKEDIAVRQTIFVDGFGNWASEEPSGMFIAPIQKGRTLVDKQGYHCCISSWERISDKNMPPKIKSGANYINSRYAQLEAVKNGYDTAIFLDHNGNLSESCGSCFFIIKNKQLITPSLSTSVLDSITRATVIKIADSILGLDVIERNITRTEIYIADEVFLCGSAMEIVPVLSVDKLAISIGEPGEITKSILNLYLQIARNEFLEFSHMVTPIY